MKPPKTSLRQNITPKDRTWYVVDAEGKTLGRLAVDIARVLTGKARPDYTPHSDGGDYVVVLNAEKVAVTGNKEDQKNYYRHSGYLGGLKTQNLAEVRTKKPTKILQDAVSGMIPRTKHRKTQMQRMTLVIGGENPHTAQKPQPLPTLS